MPREGSGAGEQAVPPVNAEPAVPSVNAKQNVPPVAHAQPSPSSAGEALQARLDAVICVHLSDRNPEGGMQVIRNRFTSCDGTAMRQFVVSATGGVRCAICCGDASFARSSRTPPLTQLHDMKKKHCGQVRERGERTLEPQARAHLEHLRRLLEGAPPEAPAEPDADDGPWPRPGQVVEVVWTRKTTLENPGKDGIDCCVVESIGEPKPDKKRKEGVPEALAYKCYAQLQSLIRLAGDTDQPYETVPESDPRPKHVHLKYKLDLAEKGRTWRIRVASSAATVSEEAPLPPPEDVDVVAPPVAEMATIEAMSEEPTAAAEEPAVEPVAEATPTERPKRAREASDDEATAVSAEPVGAATARPRTARGAPMKACPNCGIKIHAGCRTCPGCGGCAIRGDRFSQRPPPPRPRAATATPQRAFAVGSLVADINAPQHSMVSSPSTAARTR